MTLIEGLTAFAMVVLVPLAATPRERSALMACGAVSSVTFLLEPGLLASAIVLPWIAAAGWIAWSRARPLIRDFRLEAAFRLLPYGYLFMGTMWLVISRYGARPLDFSHTIVALTAVHFHYAGYIAPNLVARLEKWLTSNQLKKSALIRICLLGVIAATPLTAAGITFEPFFGALGAFTFALALITASLTTLATKSIGMDRLGALLVRLSALSIVVAIVLAVIYAVGQWLGTPSPSIATMTRTHGLLNAFGYSLCGLLGWNAIDRALEMTARRGRS